MAWRATSWRLLATVLVVLFAVRVKYMCPAYESPPDTSVSVGQQGWDVTMRRNIAEHGYAHLVGLLNRSEVESLRSVAYDFCYGAQRKALPLTWGGYSVPAFLDLDEFSEARWLKDDPRIHRVLKGAFNGADYRFASHHDVGCDFVGVWHKDYLRGPVAKFQKRDIWAADEDGERHQIYKVMVYLQDHEHDEQALKVVPGSHVLRDISLDRGYTALHPSMGDAVIFEQRLSHAGNTFYNPFGSGRLFMQVGFGKVNAFTDEFERGTIERQQTYQKKMLTSAQARGLATVVTDAKFALLGAIFTALPPQLLNYFADASGGTVGKLIYRK
mmetsp:Transcript_23996/g.66726  ORF Transcript_23996/g.66726 Transcript_23996/m.66726 type:complete len:328 (-) Transcript_23996:151-1134(-)